MGIAEAIKVLNLMIEPHQERNNEAIRTAVSVMTEKVRSNGKTENEDVHRSDE